MRKLKKSSLALAIGLALGTSANAEVKNYYANGMGNGENESIISSKKSAEKLEAESGKGDVYILQNTSNGFGFDLLESIRQKFSLDDLYEKLSNFNDISQETLKGVTGEISKHRTKVQEEVLMKISKSIAFSNEKNLTLTSIKNNGISPALIIDLEELGFSTMEIGALKSMESVERSIQSLVEGFSFLKSKLPNYRNSLEYSDKERMRSEIQNQLDTGNKINIVAHSQGNFYSNQVLNENFLGMERDIKLLSVATPDNKVFGGGKYVTLKEDMVSWGFLGAYSGNMSNYKNFPEYKNLPWYSKYNPFSLLFYPGAKAEEVMGWNKSSENYGDWTGHGFLSAYMKGYNSKNFIVSNFKKNYETLKKIDTPDIKNNMFLSNFTASKKTVKAGEKIYVSVTQNYVGNQDRDDVHTSEIGFHLTKSKSISSAIKYFGSAFSDIGSDKTSEYEKNVPIIVPKDTPAGRYYIMARADEGKKVAETDESDNLSFIEINVESSAPKLWSDIYVTNQRLRGNSVYAGSSVKAYSDQRYRGNINRRDLPSYPKLGYYLSKDRYLSSDDIYLDYDSSSIGADDLYDSESETLDIPFDTKSGNYYIIFVADYLKKISETNENNNISYVKFEVKAKGITEDIYLSSESIDDKTLYRGQGVYVRVKVNHRGILDSDSIGRIYTSYYLLDSSEKMTYLDYDYSYIGTDDKYDTERERIKIPRSTPKGWAYIIIKTDDKNGKSVLSETNESNNIRLLKVIIR